MVKPTSVKVPRKREELLDRLRDHIRLLQDYCHRAFEERDSAYLGEIATKLRLLVCESGTNKPLLLNLMDEYEIRVTIRLGGPPIKMPAGQPNPGDVISVRKYLALKAFGIHTASRGYLEVTNNRLIHIWAAQNGAAHEDPELEEEYVAARDSGLLIGGLPALSMQLKVIARTIFGVAKEFLQRVGTA